MTADNSSAPPDIGPGLVNVRRRRWFLWLTIAAYLPGLVIAMQLGLSSRVLTWLFGAWVAWLCVAVGLATVIRCPRCGQQFHTNGPTFLPVRKCVHCGLHVNSDKHNRQ